MSKNGVRLSSILAQTLGVPTSGRVVFVYAIQNQLPTSQENGKYEMHLNRGIKPISMHACNELRLELLPFKQGVKLNGGLFSMMNSSLEKSRERTVNDIPSSPRTPSSIPRFSSPSGSQLVSPIREESMSSSRSLDTSVADSFDIEEVLRDESAKKILQTCAASWLYSRNLLCGNIISMPIMSEFFFFQVMGASKIVADDSREDLMCGKNNGSQHVPSEIANGGADAFVMHHETKVHLYLSSNSESNTFQKRSSSCMLIESKTKQAHKEQKISKIGGLSKEYVTLKDIIVSSSVKDSLSRYVMQ